MFYESTFLSCSYPSVTFIYESTGNTEKLIAGINMTPRRVVSWRKKLVIDEFSIS